MTTTNTGLPYAGYAAYAPDALEPGKARSLLHQIDMPCTDSSGSGVTMTVLTIFTATMGD